MPPSFLLAKLIGNTNGYSRKGNGKMTWSGMVKGEGEFEQRKEVGERRGWYTPSY